jgi:hypothetical protein
MKTMAYLSTLYLFPGTNCTYTPLEISFVILFLPEGIPGQFIAFSLNPAKRGTAGWGGGGGRAPPPHPPSSFPSSSSSTQ